MSAVASADFSEALRLVGNGLALPLQQRVRILRELAFDLEELRSSLVAQGVPAEEAHRRATEALVPDADALRQLDRIHTPLYRRATRGVMPDRLRRLERGGLAVATAGVVAVEAWALRQADLFGDPSSFLAPVLVVGAVLFALMVAKVFELFIKGDHVRPQGRLGAILGVSAVTLGLGVAGTFLELYQLAATLEASPELAQLLAPLWLARTAVLLTVALLVAVSGALGWFILSQWVALAEGAQQEILGLPRHTHTHPHNGRTHGPEHEPLRNPLA